MILWLLLSYFHLRKHLSYLQYLSVFLVTLALILVLYFYHVLSLQVHLSLKSCSEGVFVFCSWTYKKILLILITENICSHK